MPFQVEGGGDEAFAGFDPAKRPNVLLHEADDPLARLSDVEVVSGGILPTSVSLALSEARLLHRERKYAGRALARWLDVPPPQVFERTFKPGGTGLLDHFKDPMTGGAMSLATARRILKPYEGTFFRKLLSTVPGAVQAGNKMIVVNPKTVTPGMPKLTIDPDKVAEATKILAANFDGNAMPFRGALGAALSVANTLTPEQLQIFSDNLRLTTKVADLKPSQQIALAHHAALANHTFGDAANMVVWLSGRDPVVKETVQKARLMLELNRQYQSDKRIRGLVSRTEGATGLMKDPSLVQATAHEPRIGDFTEAGFEAPVARVLAMLQNPDSLQGEYRRLATQIGKQVRITNELFDAEPRSPIGEAGHYVGMGFGALGDGFNLVWSKIAAGLVLAGSGFGGLGAIAAGVPKDAVLEEMNQRNHEANEIYYQRRSLSDELEQVAGLPRWMAVSTELAASLYFDPYVLAGKVAKGFHEARFIGSYGGELESWGSKVSWWLSRPLGKSDIGELLKLDGIRPPRGGGSGGGFTPPELLYNAARYGKDNLAMYDDVTSRFRAYYDVDGISPEFSDWAFRWINYATDTLKLSKEEVIGNVRDMWAVVLGAKPVEDSWAWTMLRDLQKARPYRRGTVPPSVAPHWTEQLVGNAAEEIVADAVMGMQSGKWSQHYLSHLGGPLRDIRIGIGAVLGDSRAGRAYRAAINTVPTQMWDLENKPGEYLSSWMTRSREFSRQEIAEAAHEMSRLGGAFTPARERLALKMLIEKEEEAFKRQAARLGYPEDVAKDVIADQLRQTKRLNAHLFGIYPENIDDLLKSGQDLTRVRSPLLETQLVNKWFMNDPVRIRQILQDGIGATRAVRAAAYRVFGQEVPAARLAKLFGVGPEGRGVWGIMRDATIQLQEWYLRFWKAAVVTQPRYILRVPLGDEQLRKLADLGLTGAILHGKVYSNLADRLGVPNRVISFEAKAHTTRLVRDDIDRVGFPNPDAAARAVMAERAFPGLDPTRAAMVEALRPDVRKIIEDTIDDLAAGKKLKGVTVNVEVPRAGAMLDEAGANSGYTHSEFYESSHRARERLLQGLKRNFRPDAKSWGDIVPGDDAYFGTWDHILRNTMGRSNLARRVLTMIADGGPLGRPFTHQEMVDQVTSYLMSKDGALVRVRLGLEKDVNIIEEHAEKVVYYVRSTTLEDREIARMALANDDNLGTYLAQIPKDVQPTLNGFKMELLGGRPNVISKMWDSYRSAILELPTNRLSRQPYFKAWYTKMRTVLLENAEHLGVDPSQEMLRRIDTEARLFAIRRVQRIMFDFRTQGRWAEMLRFVAPFAQPWMEAFQVWGHLIKQNPAIAAYIRLLHQGALRTGFLYKDESGEERIPNSFFLFGGSLLDMLFARGGVDVPGFSLSGPASSLNFFFNSTFPVPLGGDRHISLPVPSLSPPISWFAQQFAANDDMPDFVKREVHTWLTQFGSTTALSMLPPYLQHVMTALGAANEGAINSGAINFLRLYEAKGQSAQQVAEEKGISVKAAERYLIKKATQQAKHLELVRGLFSFLFPVGPTVQWPTEELGNTYREYTAKYGIDKGTNKFIEDYPDHKLLAISSTFWARPGSPVSIPANEFTDKLLHSPGVEAFAKQNPRWVFALLPSKSWELPYDKDVFFRQMDAEWRKGKNPARFFADADSTYGWEAWRAIRDHWDAVQQQMSDDGLNEGDVSWKAAKSDYDHAVDSVKALYPGFAKDIDTFEAANHDPKIEQEARSMLEIPIFRDSDTGQGVAAYLSMRDEIEKRMSGLNITSLLTKTAETSGILKDYQDGVAQIIKDHPEFERAYQYFWQEDLQGVVTKGDKIIDGLSEQDRETFYSWDVEWNGLQHQAFDSANSAAASLSYINQRDMANRAYQTYGNTNRNPMKVWWETLTVPEKKQYTDGVLARPYVFLSRFDRQQVLKVPTDDQAEGYWVQVGEANAAIAKIRHDYPGATFGPLYDRVDRMVQQFSAQSSTFRDQVAAANVWGSTFMSGTDYTSRPGPEGEAWGSFFRSLGNMQVAIDAQQIHGSGDPDPQSRALYGDLRLSMESYVQKLRDYSPGFDRSWTQLERDNGPDYLMDMFFPDTWYRLGGY